MDMSEDEEQPNDDDDEEEDTNDANVTTSTTNNEPEGKTNEEEEEKERQELEEARKERMDLMALELKKKKMQEGTVDEAKGGEDGYSKFDYLIGQSDVFAHFLAGEWRDIIDGFVS